MNRTARTALFLVLAVLTPLLVTPAPARAAQLTKFEAVEGALVDGPEIFKNQDMAQSFTATQNYRLLRVEVNVHDLSDDIPALSADPLDLTIQTDAAGLPSGTVLASSQADGVLGYNWLAFDLFSSLDVLAGQVYWIVLEDNNNMNQPDGYKWGKQVGDPYAEGVSAIRTGGGLWSRIDADDLLFRTWGLQGPVIAAGLAVDSSTAGAGDPLVYTVFFNNTGTESAGSAWANATLPANLTYEADTAAFSGGTVAGPLSWVFSDVAIGPHSFDILTRVDTSAFDGLVLNVDVALEYTNDVGLNQERTEASVPVVIRAPSVSVDKVATPQFLGLAENLTYTITMVNAGSRPSPWVWVNDTLPGEVDYLGNTAASLSPFVSESWDGTTLRFVFANLTKGTFLFTIAARTKPGLLNGTAFTNTVTLDPTDSRGIAVRPSATASATARIYGASIQVAMTANVATVAAGQEIRYRIRYDNRGTAQASSVWINDTLPSEVAYVSDTGGGALLGGVVRFAFTNVSAGLHSFTIIVRVLAGTSDGYLIRNAVNLDLTDSDGRLLAPSASYADVLVVAPLITVRVLGSPIADPGDLWEAQIEVSNLGNASAAGLWLNRTLPPELAWASDEASTRGGTPTTSGWRFANVAPGGFTFRLWLTVARGLANGTQLPVTLTAEYVDEYGLRSTAPPATTTLAIVTPDFTVTANLVQRSVPVGETVAMFVEYANVGGGVAAHVWMNVSVPEGVEVASASQAWVATSGLQYTWHLTNVGPTSGVLRVTLRVVSPVAARAAVSAELTFTDANENLVGTRSSETTIETPLAGWSPQTWGLVLLLALVTVLASFIGYRVYGLGRGDRAQIHQLFLLHKSGLLIKHYSRTLRGDLDSDILAAMIVAVQNFVKESFRFRRGDLEEMKYGTHKILLVHGQKVILAALVSGHYLERLKSVLRVALQRLEQDYSAALEDWDGLVGDFDGMDAIMDQTLQGRPPYRNGTEARNGAPRPPSRPA